MSRSTKARSRGKPPQIRTSPTGESPTGELQNSERHCSELQSSELQNSQVGAVALRVTPRSHRNQVVGLREGMVALRLQAPPVDGAANAALLAYVAELLAVPRSSVQLIRGHSSRQKWVAVAGWSAADLRAQLLARA